ncbi:MAG: ArsR/SmtB family transcription factor [Halolamina sp.]
MDSAVLLDLLGNENRRRILRLLSHKPCYVTEISEYLGVSPKAVIDHLRRLEEAGLIESRTDDRRRKYFHISRSLRLEVSVSPYGFGAKSAYPANPSLDMAGRCSHLSLDVEVRERTDGDGGRRRAADGDPEDERAASESVGEDGDPERSDSAELAELAEEFAALQSLENELSLAQRWVHGRITDILDRLNERIGTEADSRFLAEVLAAVADTDGSFEAVVESVNADAAAVDDALTHLGDRGLVDRRGDRWVVGVPAP